MLRKAFAVFLVGACGANVHAALRHFPGNTLREWQQASVVLARVAEVRIPRDSPVVVTLDILATLSGSLDATRTPRVTSNVDCAPEGASEAVNVPLFAPPRAGPLVVAVLERGAPDRGVAPDWRVMPAVIGFMPFGEALCEVRGPGDERFQRIMSRVRALQKLAAANESLPPVPGGRPGPASAPRRVVPPPVPSPPSGEPAGRSPAPTLEKTVSFRFDGGAALEMVLIPAGTFRMGDDVGDRDERPAHTVTITKPFYLARYAVTQELWRALVPEQRKSNNVNEGREIPEEFLTWGEAQRLLARLNAYNAMTVQRGAALSHRGQFRLPTEAEWEYACRAGTTTRYSFGDSERELGGYAWFDGNAHPVGRKKPNAWGLYDMHGNVWQWCSDWYSGDYYGISPRVDPKGPAAPTPGRARVLRGGSARSGPSAMRSSFRYWWPEANAPRVVPPYAGVRVAMTIGEGDPLAAGPDANIRAIEKEEEEDAESAGSDPVRRARICWFSASSGVLLLLGLLGVLLFRRHRRSSKSGEIGGQKSDTIPITDRHE